MTLFGKLRRSSHWPSTVAHIDEIGLFPGTNKVGGSGAFTVNGEYYSVLIERDFKSVRDAETWIARMQTSPNVTIRYNPDNPSDNVIDEQAL